MIQNIKKYFDVQQSKHVIALFLLKSSTSLSEHVMIDVNASYEFILYNKKYNGIYISKLVYLNLILRGNFDYMVHNLTLYNKVRSILYELYYTNVDNVVYKKTIDNINNIKPYNINGLILEKSNGIKMIKELKLILKIIIFLYEEIILESHNHNIQELK